MNDRNHITELRRMLGLEAVWGIDALNQTVRNLCDDLGAADADQAEMMTLRLQIRGVTARINDLASVIMSAIDNDNTTANLYKLVHGRSLEVEVPRHD